MNGKYIIVENSEIEQPVLFPYSIQHREVMKNQKIVSAGFWKLNKDNKYECYGESTSLDLASRKQDGDILNIFFNLRQI
jgi:hypothetical protein